MASVGVNFNGFKGNCFASYFSQQNCPNDENNPASARVRHCWISLDLKLMSLTQRLVWSGNLMGSFFNPVTLKHVGLCQSAL